MLRPPQPAVYVFLLDVSRQAVETGYVKAFCDSLLDELDKLPGDGRTQVSFITYDRTVHFYQMPDGATQPTQLTVCDIDGENYKIFVSYYGLSLPIIHTNVHL